MVLSLKFFALAVIGSANERNSSPLHSVWIIVSNLPQECPSLSLKALPITIVQGLTKGILVSKFPLDVYLWIQWHRHFPWWQKLLG